MTHPRSTARLALLLAPLVSLAACGGGESEPDDTDASADVADVGDGSGTDAGTDVAPDGDDADAVDVTDEEVVTIACEDDDGCPDDHICVDSVCESLVCAGPADWVRCQTLFNRLGDERGRYAVCSYNVCRQPCYYDTDCGEGEICTDFGECHPFTGDLSVPAPFGATTGTLQAGVANTLMNFPIGVPLGGYGQRAAFNDGRYAESLKASVGEFHGLYARAVVIDNGDRHLMIMRLPVIFTSMATHEAVARALQERTGEDWRSSLVISSTHTHSGPCRHWHLPIEAAAPLGSFGIGEFHQWFFELLNQVAVDTALAALDDMAPAKIGWDIVEAYDTDDQVGRDRWSQSPPFDDNRALLMRIDGMDDVPRAVLFSFGAHGTDNDTDFLTGDAPGAAEHAYEAALGEQYGHYIPAFFVNENSGTMGPASGAGGHDFPMGLEHLGYAFVQKTWDRFLAMETTDQLTLRSRSTRFPISYDLLDYERGQFSADFAPPFGGEYSYGGLSCVGDFGGDDDYATHETLEGLTCAGALHFLLYNNPPTTLTRSVITAIELNGLTVLTMPGELSQELSWQVVRELRDQFGVDPANTWTWGYANDHLFYLLPTNLRGADPTYPGQSTPQPIDSYPDFAFSFLQGGYESTMSMWGPNEGDFLVARAVEAYRALTEEGFVPTLPQPLPDQYATRPYDPFPVDVTAAADIGRWVSEVPESVHRLESLEFAWVGGDPGAEMPQVPVVTLQMLTEGGFEDVIGPDQLPYSNLGPYFVTRVRQPVENGPWEWVAHWEELQDFPTGTYRFHVAGHYLDEGGTRQEYALDTRQFDLLPVETVIVTTGEIADGALSGTAGFPVDVRGRFHGPGADPGTVSGNYRMRHPRVPTGVSAPLESLNADGVRLTLTGGDGPAIVLSGDAAVTVTTSDENIGGRMVPVTRFEVDLSSVAAGTYSATVAVEDALGNSGSSELAELVVP